MNIYKARRIRRLEAVVEKKYLLKDKRVIETMIPMTEQILGKQMFNAYNKQYDTMRQGALLKMDVGVVLPTQEAPLGNKTKMYRRRELKETYK